MLRSPKRADRSDQMIIRRTVLCLTLAAIAGCASTGGVPSPDQVGQRVEKQAGQRVRVTAGEPEVPAGVTGEEADVRRR